jgi:cytochrome c-type biogenesis protein CcmE
MSLAPKHQRLLFLLFSLILLGLAAFFILTAFRQNLVYFYTPSDVLAQHPEPGRTIRLGGMVKRGSLEQHGNDVRFLVTDNAHDLPVHYTGLLPNLFREGQGVIAEGALQPDGTLGAQTILAKHDENYMPPEVAKKLKSMGHWKTDYGKAP